MYEIVESCNESKQKLENLLVYLFVKQGQKDKLVNFAEGLSENGKKRILEKIDHMWANHKSIVMSSGANIHKVLASFNEDIKKLNTPA